MFTSKVWTDDRRLLQSRILGAKSRHTDNFEWKTFAQGPYVAAGDGVERATFRTEGTDHQHSTNHDP